MISLANALMVSRSLVMLVQSNPRQIPRADRRQRKNAVLMKNPRWERFAQLVASGQSGAAGYQACYPVAKASAEAAASRLLRNVTVSARVAELRKASATMNTLTVQRRRELLSAMAEDPNEKTANRIKAIELDAKLAGELNDKPQINVAVAVNVLTPERQKNLQARTLASIERRKQAQIGN